MNDNSPDVSRRRILRMGLGGAAGLLTSAAGVATAADPTPSQTEGPFHPAPNGRDQRLLTYLDRDSDLTYVTDVADGAAFGRQVYVTGVVTDEADNPVQGALVEIWQACVSARYNHRGDPGRAWLDPNFQYWGRATTDRSGRYVFHTVVPGAYRASRSWIRPPHIHYKISRRGFRELTTQMYFEGVTFYYGGRFWPARVLPGLNRRDGVLASVPRSEWPSVTSRVRRPRPGEGLPADAQVCPFDIVLRRLRTSSSPGGGPLLSDLLSR